MRDVQYDERVLQTSVNRLYSQARSLVASLAFLGLLLGGIGGFVFAKYVEAPTEIWVLIGCGLGTAFGYALAQSRAFALRLQAQTLLVTMQIEKNTRPAPEPMGTTDAAA